MSLTTNLINYYRLNGSGSDNVGNNPLTPTAIGWSLQSGIIAQGAQLAGSGSILTGASNVNLRSKSAFSVSAWINTGNLTTIGNIANQWTSGAQALMICRINSATLEFFIANAVGDTGTNFISATGSILTTNKWYHAVFVYDGTLTGNTNRAKIYLNATQKTCTATGTIPAITTAATSAFNLGALVTASSNMTGFLDEVGVWDRALTGSEITTLYNSGFGLAYPFNGAIYPNLNTAQFCYWLLHGGYTRFTTARQNVINTVLTAGTNQTTVTEHQWQQFQMVTAPYYSIYLGQLQQQY